MTKSFLGYTRTMDRFQIKQNVIKNVFTLGFSVAPVHNVHTCVYQQSILDDVCCSPN